MYARSKALLAGGSLVIFTIAAASPDCRFAAGKFQKSCPACIPYCRELL